VASRYAAALLVESGCGEPVADLPSARAARGGDGAGRPGAEALHPAHAWARSGAMALTGWPDAAPRLAPGPLASCAAGALLALERLAGPAFPAGLDGAALLGERAALAGLARRGTLSPGGGCRLLRAADGWLALSLVRADDWALLPAWLSLAAAPGDWDAVAGALRAAGAEEADARARLLGLAAAVAGPLPPEPPPWRRVAARGPRRARASGAAPLVLDLSSLWAGPLCAQLLGLAGARVVKLESASRPDGARGGPAALFDLLHAGKASAVLDLATPDGRERLRRLAARADVVVESARPRALRQLGVDAEALVAETPGLVWVSLTGYGRRGPGANWVAYGDDAAVAAGLAQATGEPEATPLFCGDAIADPLAGIHAAVSALAALRSGEAVLLDLSLRDVAAHAALFAEGARDARVRRTAAGFEVEARGRSEPVLAPRARRPAGRARPLGADTEAVLRELAC
jgi:crotonobetainyl-CoA:carnitine CoA-transferase CaiB-like acyl-CoA transferase